MLCLYKKLLASKRIILASNSERRRQIIDVLEIPVEVMASPFDEESNRPPTTVPSEFTSWTASQKALAVVDSLRNCANPPDIVIGADTVVVLENKILGKPTSPQHANETLQMLSGNTHTVVTGLSIFYKKEHEYFERRFSEETLVTMAFLNKATIESYVESGEPLDKAGSYGIQGLGGSLIKSISGDYFNVVGLPVHRFTAEMVDILNELGHDLTR